MCQFALPPHWTNCYKELFTCNRLPAGYSFLTALQCYNCFAKKRPLIVSSGKQFKIGSRRFYLICKLFIGLFHPLTGRCQPLFVVHFVVIFIGIAFVKIYHPPHYRITWIGRSFGVHKDHNPQILLRDKCTKRCESPCCTGVEDHSVAAVLLHKPAVAVEGHPRRVLRGDCVPFAQIVGLFAGDYLLAACHPFIQVEKQIFCHIVNG